MKKLYTIILAAAVVAGATAAPKWEKVSVKDKVQHTTMEKRAPRTAKKNAKGITVLETANSGLKFKSLKGFANKKFNLARSGKAHAKAPVAAPYFEGFEDADLTNFDWLPEGWTRQSKSGLTGFDTWSAGEPFQMWVEPFEGEIAMFCNYNDEVSLDEWLISPEITVAPDQVLSYGEMVSPLYMFSADNFNEETMEFEGPRVAIGDFKVMISEDGGANWTCLRSIAQEYAEASVDDMIARDYLFDEVMISLADYAGKNVKIAFVSQGKDTNTLAIDAVKVDGMPMPLAIANPTGSLYLGIGKDMGVIEATVGYYPPYAPLTWYNMTEVPGTFSWSYTNAEGVESTAEGDELTVTYKSPELAGEDGGAYYAPMLNGEAPGFGSSSKANEDLILVAGFPGIDEEGEKYSFGSSVSTYGNGATVYTNEDELPVYGYAPGVDEFWSKYTYENDVNDKNWAKLTGLINAAVSPEVPMVINGGWVLGMGSVTPNAKFVYSIMVTDEEGMINETPIATDTITSADFIDQAPYIILPFQFDTPVVMSQEVAPMYLVRLSGFNDAENVSFFAPLMTAVDDVQGMACGWSEKILCSGGTPRSSYAAIAGVTGVLQSFYFMLDTEYPYFQTDVETIEVAPNVATEVPVDAYYEAGKYTIEAPEWVDAEITGSGAATKLVVAVTGSEPQTGELTVSAPGLKRTFTVKQTAGAGVVAVGADNNAPTVYYNLQGIRVDAPRKGEVYIIRKGASVRKATL